jgi:two-component system, LytTR family, sensor kinase
MKLLSKFWIIFGAWTLYGSLMAVNVHYRSALWGRPAPWDRAFIGELSYAWLWCLATPLILWLGYKLPIRRDRWLLPVLVHLPAIILIGAVTKGIWDLTIPAMLYGTPTRSSLMKTMLSSLDFSLLNYALVLLFQAAADYYRRFQAAEVRSVQLEGELARAQLTALRMQLHPHFLFNTLHAISELIHENSAAAERMIARLSEFLRLTLENAGASETTLKSEIDFLERYLEIEKIRFEDQLKVEFDVDAKALDAQVPNLILQPIVENALKHGLRNHQGERRIRIVAAQRGEALQLQVSDNGKGLDPARREAAQLGVGLSNTAERLRRLYQKDHLLSMHNRPEGGFEVTIQIPFRLLGETG